MIIHNCINHNYKLLKISQLLKNIRKFYSKIKSYKTSTHIFDWN